MATKRRDLLKYGDARAQYKSLYSTRLNSIPSHRVTVTCEEYLLHRRAPTIRTRTMSSSKSEKTSPAASVTVLSANPSTLSICAPSCSQDLDVEKADGRREVDEAEMALAHYVVPVLEKGVKTALSKPTSPWVRFRVWYNPYRMVSSISICITDSALTSDFVQLFTLTFALNMVGILMACLRRFPYAEKHGAAIALGNIMAAVACRNELFLRCVFWVVVKLFQKVQQAFLICPTLF